MLAQSSARTKKVDLDPRRLWWSVTECARAMGVDRKTAYRRMRDARALQRVGGRQLTSRDLIREGFGRLAPGFIAALEALDDDES